MNTAYLNRVLIYLQQELPEEHREHITLTGEQLAITIPGTVNFDPAYEALHQAIACSINRIRNREIDLNFTVRSENQECDFRILK